MLLLLLLFGFWRACIDGEEGNVIEDEEEREGE